jgi:hypothetical protein
VNCPAPRKRNDRPRTSRAQHREAVRAAILARLAGGHASKADLNGTAGLVDCGPYLAALVEAREVVLVGHRYHLASGPIRTQAEEIAAHAETVLADLAPHRLIELCEVVGASPSVMTKALAGAIQAGRVVRIGRGVYALSGAFPDDMVVSTRDPLQLTPGEARCLRHLMQRLVVDQVVGLAALEALAEALVADDFITAQEADTLVGAWARALIAKGRVEVREGRLVILRDVAGARVRLAIEGMDHDDLADSEVGG